MPFNAGYGMLIHTKSRRTVTKDFITKGQLRLNEIDKLTCGVYRIRKADNFDSKNMATIRTLVEKVK